MANEPQGCLAIILKLLGIGGNNQLTQAEPLPFRQRDQFLSAAELSFFHTLIRVTGSHFYVCTKVRISDLLYVIQRTKNLGHANRIDRKHVDFVLCNPKTMQPSLIVELDDSSHQRQDRRDRDLLVDAAFAAADLPILHVRCQRNYATEELKQQIRAALAPAKTSSDSRSSVTDYVHDPPEVPACPKCNIPMVERRAKRGSKKGRRFWACPSYPDCRKIISID